MKTYQERKKRGGKRHLRVLAVMLCFCLLVTACPIENSGITAMAAESAATGRSSYMYYDNSGKLFNVKGIDNNTLIQTTFMDAGYRTASAVSGGSKVDWNGAGEVAMGNSLYGTRDISLVYNGRYAKITYTVVNRGSASQSFQVGSSADVMIGDNDCAPVVGNKNGLVMSGSPKNNYTFNLVAPTVSTLWYGYWTKAYENMFTNLADRSTPYNKDSGMAWSWSGTVAPGRTWRQYVLVGVGELPDPPRVPTLTNRDPQLQAGTPTVFTGTAEPGNTVCIEVGGEEFTGTADQNGNFSVTVTPPQGMPEGETDVNYYAVSADGGISDVETITATVTVPPSIVLTDTAVSTLEDTALSDTWYRSFISSSSGTVTYNASAVKTGTPGSYTVTYTAKKTGYADATAKLTVTVLPLPLELSGVTAARVSGKDSFTLTASLLHTGGGTISETGFVWGIMQNPTVSLNNGSKATSSVVKTKGGALTVTAEQIVDGVTYYARAYVKTSDGNIYYSPQKNFSINGKSYGTFTIKYNGGDTKTFTVTRTGGTDGAQTVYYRTVNGSAIGGTHFTHQASTLTFAAGEASKQITITEKSVTTLYNSKAATAYSNADRTYQVEIYRVDGGGALGSTTRATRTMAKSSSYVVNRNVYTNYVENTNSSWKGTVTDAGWDKNPSMSLTMTPSSSSAYINNTAYAQAFYILMDVKEIDDGYQYIRFSTDNGYVDEWKFEIKPGGKGDSLRQNAHFPCNTITPSGWSSSDGVTNFNHTTSSSNMPYGSSGQYLSVPLSVKTMNITFDASGSGDDDWWYENVRMYRKPLDNREPQLLGVAPMDTGTYKAGDKITVSLVFDEIVDNTNSTLSSVSLSTTWGTFTYAGGADTNVLYFTGTVPSNATGTLTVNSITGASYIKDMCGPTGTTTSGSGSVTVNVDTKKPAVSIANTSIENKTGKATITATNANTLQYTWSQSSAMPVTGWLTTTSGQIVSTKQTSGTWYLHVLGTYNATGTTAYTKAAFDFSSSTSGSLPELTLSADNSTWAKSRPITLTRTPSTATVKVKTPSGTTSTVSGTSYTATANGTYTFTLTSGSETVVKSITVSKIDTTAPTAVITGPASLTQNENVILTITPTDAGGAGVKTVTGTWTRTTNGGTAATVTATVTKNSDGTYSATTPGSTGNNYTYKLNVTVTDNVGNTGSKVSSTYTVNLKAPTVSVNRTSYNNMGHTYSYTVNANGNTVNAVQLPDGTITTALTGTFTLTSPGTYYVTASDTAGHVVRSSAMTVDAGVDGDAPEVRLYQQDTDWADQARIDVSIYEEGSIQSAVRKKEGVSSNTAVTYSKEETSVYSGVFTVTQNGTYTVTVTDANGNVGTASITVTNIDATAPKVTCRVDATPNEKSGWYTDSPVPIILDFADEAGQEGGTPSGIQSVQYMIVTDKVKPTSGLSSLSASAISKGTYTYNRSNNGKCYLYYIVKDKKGNETEGFSDLIQKDSNAGSGTITGPDTGQSVSKGLAMNIKLTYGPAGGYLTAGPTVATSERIATMGQHAEMTQTIDAAYTAKTPGLNYFRYYRYAVNGETGTGNNYWSFYVRQITFDSKGGSAVESQLVWDRNNTTVYCTAVKPTDPTRTGYTFGGWYTDSACTAGKEFDFNTQVRANTTLYAKWTANTYNVTYHLKNPDGSAYTPAETVKKYTYGQGLTLPKPTQTGFAFCGWYDNTNYTGEAYTSIPKTATGNKEYYAYFKDTQKPVIAFGSYEGVASSGAKDDWQRAQAGVTPQISVSCTDNVAVKEVLVQVDNSSFSKTGVSANGTNYKYELQEGEHTYTFRARDDAGNETVSEPRTVKLDRTKPKIGEITYEKKVDSFLNWIIGKESLIVHIPVTDSLSGVTSLTYTETTITGLGETTEEKTVSLSGKPGEQTVDLKLDADWKGRISNITCTDKAGNVSDSVTVGGENGGVIVEDNAPVISIREADMTDGANPKPGNEVSADYYAADAAPTLYVSVQDEAIDVSAGIRSITYSVDGGEEQTVSGDFISQLSGKHEFTIPMTGYVGAVNVTVKAADYAGNTAQKGINVKIKGKEAVPKAKPAYPKDALANLTPGAAYEITVPAGEDGTAYPCIANEQGEIPLLLPISDVDTIDLCGETIGIVKTGDGTNIMSSDPQTLAIAERPSAPTGEVTPELAQDLDDAIINITISAEHTGKKEYSIDGGKTWTDVPDGNVIKNLAPGDVLVRMKATETSPRGKIGTITVTPSSATITVKFALNYAGAEEDSAPSEQSGLTCKETLDEPEENPARDGFDFTGWYKSAECGKNEKWRFAATEDEGANVVGDIIDRTKENYREDYVVVGGVITVALYAGWRENVKPKLNAALMDDGGQKDESNWYQNLFINVTYSDNVGVTKLYAKIDDGEDTELAIGNSTGGTGETDSDGNEQYHFAYHDLEEGEHTYTFKAVDAAGNEMIKTLTAKLDLTKPVLGEASFNEGHRNLWGWVIQKDRLLITVPVREAGSGIDAVEYTLTPADGNEDVITGNATVEKVSGNDADYTAAIAIAPDFKGAVTITAKDKAGNVSDTKIIGADGSGIKGVIVEDKEPVITILADRGTTDDASTQSGGTTLSEDYYNSAPKLFVKVEDDGADERAITSGLETVSWKIGDSAEHTESADFESDVKTSHSFTIDALEGKTGILQLTVKATDQAGNTAEKTVAVSIKARAEKPTPDIDYLNEKLTGLVPDGKYGIGEATITADAQGCIAIREEWFGGERQIYRKGEGNTLDSENVDLSIAGRPDAPDVSVSKDETIQGRKDAVLTGVDAAMEYSVDSGVTWTSVKESDITDGRMENRASGRILFRTRAANSAPCGEPAEVTIGAGRLLTVIFEENGGSSVSDLTGKRWHDTVAEPEKPERAGYAFEGWYQDAACKTIWHFASAGTEADTLTDDLTLYAKWKDNVSPAINAVLTDGMVEKDGENWYQNLSVTLTYSDNEGVTKLYVQRDGGDYEQLAVRGSAAGKDAGGKVQYQYIYNSLAEGEHTYTFKAVDAAGNEIETKKLNAKLDSAKPALGEESFNEGHKSLWNWIIRKKNLVITIPVREAGSGLDVVEYTLTPADGSGADGSGADENGGITTGNATVKKVSGNGADYTATITIATDFMGTITVVAKDKVGNISDTKTIGTDGDGIKGVIVEDNAPGISFSVDGDEPSGDYYEEAPELTVYVADDTDEDGGNVITGGIASVIYQVGSGDAKAVNYDYTSNIVISDSFTIPAAEIPGGVTRITVTATDHAGNQAEQSVTVKVKALEKTPNVVIGYRAETLTGLMANTVYLIDDVEMTADANGRIALEENWMSSTLSIVKPGNGSTTVNSAPQNLSVPARPGIPAVSGQNETYPDAGDGALTGLNGENAYEISNDGGSTWKDAALNGTELQGLAAGTYQLRVKAVEGVNFRGEAAEVTVGTTPATPYETPNGQIDYRKETLTGFVPDAEYTVEYSDGTEEGGENETGNGAAAATLRADADGNITIDEKWFGMPLSIVRKGNGKDKLDSGAQSLHVPNRPEIPSPAGADETGPDSKDGKLTGLTEDTSYDISADGGKTWVDRTADADGEIKGVDTPASYIVRVSATDSDFASLPGKPVKVDGYKMTVTFMANGEVYQTVPVYYGGELKELPTVPPKKDAGNQTYAGEWCSDEQGTSAVFTNITADMTVYAVYTPTYAVTLHTNGGSGGTPLPFYIQGRGAALPTDWAKAGYIFDGWYDNEKCEGTVVTDISDTETGGREYWAKWTDNIAPVIGTLEYSYQPKKSGQWLMGKDSLIITVPVTEEGSGADEITYTVTPEGGTAEEKTADIKISSADKNDASKITVSADFKGTITITCTDKAGNTSESVTVGSGLNATGIIIEDNAPQIECKAAPDITVTITDNKNNAISSGIASVSYRIGNGSAKTVDHDYTTDMVVNDSFIIPASEIPAGEMVISVTATDHAGNSFTKAYNLSGETGTISKDVEKDEKAPDTILSTSKEELADIILTEKEKTQAKNGTDIKFILDVKDAGNTASSGDKTAVQAVLKGSSAVRGFVVGQYLDISLFKMIGADRNAISQTAKKLTIVIDVPDSLKSKGSGKPRTYAIIRVHDGVAETLKDLDDDADTITIATDRFSTYAIVYKEAGSGEDIKSAPTPTGKEKRMIALHSGLKTIQTGKKLQISWGRVNGADGYSVYVQYCAKNFTAKSLNQVRSGKKTKIIVKKVNGKKLDTTKNFKVYVVAYKKVGKKKSTLAKTLTVHVAGKDSKKYTNVKTVRVKKTSYTLKKGGSVKIKPKAVLYDKRKKQLSVKHTKQFRYMSSNKKVATVSSTGKVKAKGVGECIIYVYAKNGSKRKIKVKVMGQ